MRVRLCTYACTFVHVCARSCTVLYVCACACALVYACVCSLVRICALVFVLRLFPGLHRAKAALNMMTRTCAQDLCTRSIFMTSVDTGWINDENPLEKAASHAAAANFQVRVYAFVLEECGSTCACAWLCVAVCGCVWLCVVVCGCV